MTTSNAAIGSAIPHGDEARLRRPNYDGLKIPGLRSIAILPCNQSDVLRFTARQEGLEERWRSRRNCRPGKAKDLPTRFIAQNSRIGSRNSRVNGRSAPASAISRPGAIPLSITSKNWRLSEFAAGTNHSRIRDRLVALGRLLPGEIAEVKERQFRIGYEIERFEGLMAAYRFGGEDMPMLNADQLEDLDRLRVALRIGIDKLERWSEFRKEANQSATGEVDADNEILGDALDEMAAAMERSARYFHPELPASFTLPSRSLSRSIWRDQSDRLWGH
jgi:hypothetical protein